MIPSKQFFSPPQQAASGGGSGALMGWTKVDTVFEPSGKFPKSARRLFVAALKSTQLNRRAFIREEPCRSQYAPRARSSDQGLIRTPDCLLAAPSVFEGMPLSVAMEGPRKCKSQRLRAKNISPSERHKGMRHGLDAVNDENADNLHLLLAFAAERVDEGCHTRPSRSSHGHTLSLEPSCVDALFVSYQETSC